MCQSKTSNVDSVPLIILPPGETSTLVELGLVELTEAIYKRLPENEQVLYGGGLGGEHGYGRNYENETFMMHSYCWCDKTNCKRCAEPNFWHKPSGFKVWWYKWIGRGMEFNQKITPVEWRTILKECLDSLPTEISLEV